MYSRELPKKTMGNLFTCLLALLLVPASVGAQNDKSKPAPKPATNNSPPPKAAPAPARPAQQAPARPAQPPPSTAQPQPHNNTVSPGGGGFGNRPTNNAGTPGNRPNNNAGTPGGGYGNRPNNNAGTPGGGGITGSRPNNAGTPGGGGITGSRPNNAGTPGGGGITGSRPNNAGNSGGGGITGSRPNNAGNSGGGGITGARPNNAGAPGGGGITGNNRPMSQRPVYVPGRNVQTTSNTDGTQRHFNTQTQTAIQTDRSGHIATVERPGLRATNFRDDGHAAHIEHSRSDGSKMVVDRSLHGDRRVEVVRRDGVRVVSIGRQGFVERPIRAGYVSRSYVVGGRTEVRVYRGYTYGSVHYYSYVPRVYYQPAFYGWAYRPWGAPVAYAWGWGPAPWFYGSYFAPEPVYPTAALWLTDYLLAENLKLSYENRMAAGGEGPDQQPALAQNGSVALTPEVKQMIAEEVQQQLAAEQAAAAQPASLQPSGAVPQSAVPDAAPPALDPKFKIFVVSAGLNVTSPSDGQACALTPGDIIQRMGRTVTDGKVQVTVLNSKEGDCPVDFATTLDVGALQDMHNQFREQISAGMEKLASNQGKGGLPSGPGANPRQVAEGQASASADAKDLLEMQVQEADRTEAEIKLASNGGQ